MHKHSLLPYFGPFCCLEQSNNIDLSLEEIWFNMEFWCPRSDALGENVHFPLLLVELSFKYIHDFVVTWGLFHSEIISSCDL